MISLYSRKMVRPAVFCTTTIQRLGYLIEKVINNVKLANELF